MTVSDLTPDALAKLEAKLVADLEVVRKVRALLEEHQRGQGMAAGVAGVAALPQTAVAAAPVAMAGAPLSASAPGTYQYIPPKPTKTYEQWLLDGLRLMPPEGFVQEELRVQLRKDKQDYNCEKLKPDIARLIREGRVVVVKTATGRIGNTYRYIPTAEELAAKAASEAANANGDAATDQPEGEKAES